MTLPRPLPIPPPKAVILCKSVHHGNTAKVARAMAAELDAEIVAPEAFPFTSLEGVELVGFGSGVAYGRMHPALFDWVRGLPETGAKTRSAFVFSTSGLPFLWTWWHGPLVRELARRGFEVLGEFHCRGHDSWGPLGIVGGLHRRHPDGHDLERAGLFAAGLRRFLRPTGGVEVHPARGDCGPSPG